MVHLGEGGERVWGERVLGPSTAADCNRHHSVNKTNTLNKKLVFRAQVILNYSTKYNEI
jgi:hypothetical protein